MRPNGDDSYRPFSSDVTAAILVFQNNETTAMLEVGVPMTQVLRCFSEPTCSVCQQTSSRLLSPLLNTPLVIFTGLNGSQLDL